MSFRNRQQAGQSLARELRRFADRDPVLLALPRGGVPVAYEVAKALSAPLDIILVRKIGVPDQRELALAAVVDGEQREIVVNEDVAALVDVPEDYIEQEATRQVDEIERRRELYLGGRAQVSVEGRTAIVVDDGIATGATVRAALRALRRRRPAHLVLAVPVAPSDTLADLSAEVDEIVCLETPEPFGSIGRFYGDFRQVSDDEVRRLLSEAAHEKSEPANVEGG